MTDRDHRAQIERAMRALTAARYDQLVDECTAVRPAKQGQTPTLDEHGNVTAPDGAEIYAGRCAFSNPATALLGGRTVTDEAGVPSQRVLKVPHEADLRPGDLVTCTASLSPGLVDDTFVVVGEDERTYATCRRYHLRGSSWLSQEVGA